MDEPQKRLKDRIGALVENLIPTLANSSEYAQKLADFVALLDRWNERKGLVGTGSPEDHFTHHVADALHALGHIPDEITFVDLGTGAGFPGVVFAVMRPNCRILLIDARDKPIAFLKEVKRRIDLPNVEIVQARLEDLDPALFGEAPVAGVSRAFSPIEKLLPIAKRILPKRELFYLGGKGSPYFNKVEVDDCEIAEAIPYFPGHPDKLLFRINIP